MRRHPAIVGPFNHRMKRDIMNKLLAAFVAVVFTLGASASVQAKTKHHKKHPHKVHQHKVHRAL